MQRSPLTASEIDALCPDSDADDAPRGDGAPLEPINEQLSEQLEALLARFAEHATQTLETPMRGETTFTFNGYRELAGRELMARLERPTCVFVVGLEPIAETLFLELPYSCFFPLLDRLLGGGQHPCPTLRRPLTRIERRMAMRIANHLLDALKSTWAPHVEVQPSLKAIECDPRVLSIGPGQAFVMAQFVLDVPVQRANCQMTFARADLPAIARTLQLGPYLQLLERHAPTLPGKCSDQLTAVMGHAQLETSDPLVEGQTLWMDACPDDPVLVYHGGHLAYIAEKGLNQGKKAIRILKGVPGGLGSSH